MAVLVTVEVPGKDGRACLAAVTVTEGAKLDLGSLLQTARAHLPAYAVPVPELNGRVVIRHLVRFSQRGRFSLPPARFWRMYQPTEKSFENKARVVAVE